MKRPWELIEGIADLVVPEDPHALAERTLDAAVGILGVQRAAIFTKEQEQMVLFASRGVDQAVLGAVAFAWSAHGPDFAAGRLLVASASATDAAPAVQTALSGAKGLAILPLLNNERLGGLLYVDAAAPLSKTQLDTAMQIARVGAVAVKVAVLPNDRSLTAGAAGLKAYLERTAPEEIAREQLVVLCERNEWNLSRVARALGVSRRTIYMRLDRYGIERQHPGHRVIKRREAT